MRDSNKTENNSKLKIVVLNYRTFRASFDYELGFISLASLLFWLARFLCGEITSPSIAHLMAELYEQLGEGNYRTPMCKDLSWILVLFESKPESS